MSSFSQQVDLATLYSHQPSAAHSPRTLRPHTHTASAIYYSPWNEKPDRISTSNIPRLRQWPASLCLLKVPGNPSYTGAAFPNFISCPQHDKLIRSGMPANIANGMNRKPSAWSIGKQAIIAKKRRSSPSSFLLAAAAASYSQLAPCFSSSACL